jgi:hypothetical protein
VVYTSQKSYNFQVKKAMMALLTPRSKKKKKKKKKSRQQSPPYPLPESSMVALSTRHQEGDTE